MASLRRKFTTEQKIHILQQAQEVGVHKAIKLHKLSYSVFTRWKQQLQPVLAFRNEDAMEIQKEKERLEKENERLKKIIANQALQLDMMNETLKKKAT